MEPAFQQDQESVKKRLAFKMFKRQSKTNIAKYEVSPYTERIFRQNERLIGEYKRKKSLTRTGKKILPSLFRFPVSYIQ
ncbi:stage II sporulation protein SB [Bacillus licheniformis]|nr:stage II sporulation protein SB [Bacillus licheniformis]